MLGLHGIVEVIVARGSSEFVRHIMSKSDIPVMGHAAGVCHLYVHEGADPAMAAKLTVDGKTTYPAACNATETLLWDAGATAALDACGDGAEEGGRRAARRRGDPQAPPAGEGGDGRRLRLRVRRQHHRGQAGGAARRGAGATSPSTGRSTPRRSSPATRRRPTVPGRGRRRRASSTTPAPASPTGIVTAWAPRSASAPTSCTPAARSASRACSPTAGCCAATARRPRATAPASARSSTAICRTRRGQPAPVLIEVLGDEQRGEHDDERRAHQAAGAGGTAGDEHDRGGGEDRSSARPPAPRTGVRSEGRRARAAAQRRHRRHVPGQLDQLVHTDSVDHNNANAIVAMRSRRPRHRPSAKAPAGSTIARCGNAARRPWVVVGRMPWLNMPANCATATNASSAAARRARLRSSAASGTDVGSGLQGGSHHRMRPAT